MASEFENRLSHETVIGRTENTVTAPVGDHLMMLSIENGSYFDFNPTAKSIWEAIETPKSLHELCKLIQSEYDVDEEQCNHSVCQFLLKLREKGMVRFG